MANRTNNNWMIHSNWTSDGKKMYLVGLLEGNKLSSKKIKECAEKMEELNKLEKSSKENRSPVWIQKTELDGDRYLYSIFFARKKPVITIKEAKEIKFGECFDDMEIKTYKLDSNNKERFTDLFLYIKKETSGSLAKKSYAKKLKDLHRNKKKKLKANAKEYVPGEQWAQSGEQWAQSGGYVKLSNGKTRKVRTYKNGTKYILLNGKKVSV
jgi:hypothetical protein